MNFGSSLERVRPGRTPLATALSWGGGGALLYVHSLVVVPLVRLRAAVHAYLDAVQEAA